jgi:hypothetical protein
MRELLTALNAKPEQIARVLATAEQNRKRPPVTSFGGGMPGGGMLMMAGGPGPGAGGGAMSGGGAGASGMGTGGGGSEGGGPPRMFGGMFGGMRPGGEGGAGPSEEDRRKLREAMQKALNGRSMQDLSPEERQKVFQEAAKAVPGMAARMGAAGQGRPGGAPGGLPMMPGSGQFSAKDLANAQLPPPPESGNNLDVLIRPGLLADVEIIIEKVPDAIHIPSQALFEKDGKPIVWVKQGSRWEERSVKPLKRTENTMIIASGVQPGEVIAMADPFAKPGAKKQDGAGAGGGGGALGGMPGGGRQGGR